MIAGVYRAWDDDLQRLVFADWCDENELPGWAEYIRNRVDSARGGPRHWLPHQSGCDCLTCRADGRAGRLFDGGALYWLYVLGAAVHWPVGDWNFAWSRGFPDKYTAERMLTSQLRIGQVVGITRDMLAADGIPGLLEMAARIGRTVTAGTTPEDAS